MSHDVQNNLTLEELAGLLKQARKTKEKETGKKITHKMIAEAIGVDRVTVGMWERGERYPGFLNVFNYCNFLGMTLDELVGLKDQQTLHLELTETERQSIFSMLAECKRKSEKSDLYHDLHALEQYLKAFLGRARSK